ncbi:hypothetical protein TURU_095788 [Turdus rufiventris]|nr:hypothetical protein TURU_095788 [Turdus rufiventris]
MEAGITVLFLLLYLLRLDARIWGLSWPLAEKIIDKEHVKYYISDSWEVPGSSPIPMPVPVTPITSTRKDYIPKLRFPLSGVAKLQKFDTKQEKKDLTGSPLAKRFSLENPSVLLPSKLLPPVQKSSPSTKPNKMCSGETEKRKNGNGYEEDRRNTMGLGLEAKNHKDSLLYPTGGDMKKRPLILPMRISGTPRVVSAAGSLLSSVQLDVQESQEMRPRSSSSSRENFEHAVKEKENSKWMQPMQGLSLSSSDNTSPKPPMAGS